MPTETFEGIIGQLANLADVGIDAILGNASTLLTAYDAYKDALNGDRAAQAAVRVEEAIASYSASYDQLKEAADLHLTDMNTVMNLPEELSPDDDEFWEELRKYGDANSKTIQARELDTTTLVLASAAGTGDGTVAWLFTDEYANEIEAIRLNGITVECVEDQNSSTEVGREEFKIYYGLSREGFLEESGNGVVGELTSKAGSGGENLLLNSSFEQLADNGSLTAPDNVPNWTWSGTESTDLEFDAVNFHKSSPEEIENGTSYSLIVKASGTLSQKLSTNRAKLDFSRPYYPRFFYNRQVGSATGSFIAHMGTETKSVTLASETGWNEVVFPLDEKLWPSNFNEDDVDFKVVFTVTGGELLVDGFEWSPMEAWGRHWFYVGAGATDFLIGKKFTATPALTGSEGKVGKMLSDLYGQYMKAATSTPSVADPS
jgi:hypothetical protein